MITKINDRQIEGTKINLECSRKNSELEKSNAATKSVVGNFFATHRSFLHLASIADVIALVTFGAETFRNSSKLSNTEFALRFLALTTIAVCAKEAKSYQKFLNREVSK